ncbi:SCA7-domain-containing protein [Dacryopinax primogenitus]|uniref:SCA7-domain-containing protein n=1 Tax=Dacryopinax primogenitus (strain DJM 731) TaxID=1858805 RepID=M5G5Y7_DACPD|nr:SCA7-domain-containing protein [Dacryopinax primogenitus]EJU03630.1 SCA7-domain-containing protein [Dacryopinax primogenitus]
MASKVPAPKRRKQHPMLVPSSDGDDSPEPWPKLEQQLLELDANYKHPEKMISNPNVWLPEGDMHVFGAAPMHDELDVRVCKDCGKPVLASAVAAHLENCKKIKALPAPKQSAKAKKTDTKPKVSPAKNGKKRKAEEDGDDEELDDTPPKKKTKKENKPPGETGKGGRFKGPINLDIHCGVINDKGVPCSRKLTCKSHAMGPKRAVVGRSRPFDELQQEMLRLNPKYKEPMKRKSKEEKAAEKAKEKEEKRLEKEREKGLKNEEKAKLAAGKAALKATTTTAVKPGLGGKKKGTAAQRAAAAAAEAAELEAEKQLDSEEEVDSLVLVAQRLKKLAQPITPVPGAPWFFLQRMANYAPCRDELLEALGGGQAQTRVNMMGGVPQHGMTLQQAAAAS